jgi:ComF family protein
VDCQKSITEIIETAHICRICGDILDPADAGASLCLNCQKSLPPFENARSCAVFQGPLRQAIHRLKYKQDLGLGESLSRLLINKLKLLQWPIDMVVAVPLSASRQRERGYNQSGLLARPLALANRVPYEPRALHRIRTTKSQVGLSAEERFVNLKDAFQADPSLVHNRVILIIDDVMTTGVTLRNCSEAFLREGARTIFCLSLARAVIHFDGFERGSGI